MRWLIVSLLFLALTAPTASASSTIDNLQAALEKAPSDSLRIALMAELAFQLQSSDLFQSITYADEAAALARRADYQKLVSELSMTLAINHYHLGNYEQTLAHFQTILAYYEREKDAVGKAKIYNNLAILYDELQEYDKAINYYQRALDLKRNFADSLSLGSTLSNLGIAYLNKKEYTQARSYFMQSLRIDKEANNTYGLIYTYENLGRLQAALRNIDSAKFYYSKSLALLQGSEYLYEQATVTNSLADLFQQNRQYSEALNLFEKGLHIARQAGARKEELKSLQGLALTSAYLQQYAKAYQFHQAYAALRDSIYNEEKLEKIHELETNFQIQEREREIELLKKDAQISSLHLARNELFSYGLIAGLLLISMGALYFYQQYQQKKYSNALLQERSQEIARTNASITSSIEYARSLQESVFPQEEVLEKYFPDALLYSRASHIVNGDFFWFHATPGYILLALVDCTGHGVPGAFITLLAKSMLDQLAIQEGISEPDQLLEQLQLRLQQTLNSRPKGLQQTDGMDIGLLKIIPDEGRACFASAKRPLYLLRNGNLQVLKQDNPTLCGLPPLTHRPFCQQEFPIQSGDRLYLFTDGITDQFGGPFNRKLMPKKLKEWLIQHQELSLSEQKKALEQFLLNWQGKQEQTDDQLLVGIQL